MSEERVKKRWEEEKSQKVRGGRELGGRREESEEDIKDITIGGDDFIWRSTWHSTSFGSLGV